MIKNAYNITIGEFTIMERTGKTGQFRLWWNILPVSLFKRQIKNVVSEFLKAVNDNELDGEIEDQEWQLMSIYKILEMKALYQMCYNHFMNGAQLNAILGKVKLPRRYRRKLKYKSDSLKTALENIKKIWGEVNTLEDLVRFGKFIENREDKYNENFSKKDDKKTENKKIYLMGIAFSYSVYVGGSTSGIKNMTLPELIELKARAEEKQKAEQAQLDKMRKNG